MLCFGYVHAQSSGGVPGSSMDFPGQLPQWTLEGLRVVGRSQRIIHGCSTNVHRCLGWSWQATVNQMVQGMRYGYVFHSNTGLLYVHSGVELGRYQSERASKAPKPNGTSPAGQGTGLVDTLLMTLKSTLPSECASEAKHPEAFCLAQEDRGD